MWTQFRGHGLRKPFSSHAVAREIIYYAGVLNLVLASPLCYFDI
jgi:hypothetical protein